MMKSMQNELRGDDGSRNYTKLGQYDAEEGGDYSGVELASTVSPFDRNEVNTRPIRQIPCQSSCCATNSNFKESYATTDNATIPLLCRCAGQRPFIPQSYNYVDFECNQIRAIGQKSARLTLDVVQQVFRDYYKESSNKDNDLVTNLKVIQNCRFFPSYIGLSQNEMALSAEHDVALPGPLLDSVIGCLAQETSTVCGQVFIAVRGSNPSNHRRTILRRRNAIKVTIEDNNLRANLKDALLIYGKYENELCSRLTPDATKLPGRIENYLKFALLDVPESVGRNLNAYIRESVFLLSINNYIKTSQDCFAVCLLVIIAFALVAYSLSLLIPKIYASETTIFITSFVNRYIGQTGAMISALQSVNNSKVKLIAAILGAICAAARAPDALGYFRADLAVKAALQRKMVSVAMCLRSLNRIYNLVKDNPSLSSSLEHFDKVKGLLESDNTRVHKMMAAIDSHTLDSPSKYFNFGPVIVAWNLLLDKDVRKLVMESLIGLGEVDTVLTLATKVAESTASHPYSLPDIADCDEAIFEVRCAHFIPVSRNSLANSSSKMNSLNKKLSGHGSIELPPLCVLTAENGAGKTTFALAWMNVLLMTQSLGIASCAAGSRVSIFDSIMTSMGVSDNNQESSHQSHERYDNELIVKLDSHPNERVFVLLDELYRGTHEEKGAKKLSELAQKLRFQSNRLKAVFITHFKSFATDPAIEAVRYTTKKTAGMKPSGVLEEGVYDFSRQGGHLV